ncbi:MAG: alpha-amylase/4-alpha-glucanotransferase domain-containing protein [Myxococcota bacterium]
MDKMNLIFVIHNHQPVGNFDNVFEMAYERSYKPFIDVLERYPKIRIGLHISGPIYEWILKERPEFIERLRALCDDHRVEILSGGFYEPMLSILSQKDIVGQIKMMNDFISEKFNQTPKGMWLTERVWEPALPALLDGTGIEYTLVDDAHFAYAGKRIDELGGYYITDKAGKVLLIYPISQKLRYAIPFAEPEETLKVLRDAHNRGFAGICYGDDGEKFGIWPRTFEWVYEQGWLVRFFETISNNDSWLNMTLPSDFISQYAPTDRIFLPTASYQEMMEWSLPADAIPLYEEFIKYLKDNNLYQRYEPFVRGGIWLNFLSKYPESNRIYRRVLKLSERIDSIKSVKVSKEAKRHIYMAQCNCSYWHGLFGGLYLNHLRNALYQNAIAAHRIIDEYRGGQWAVSEIVDTDDDLNNEITLDSNDIYCIIKPLKGAVIEEIDFKDVCFCLTNVLTRRAEGYHHKLLINQDNTGSGGVKSIHEVVRSKESGLENFLIYDRYQRYSFMDHFLGKGVDVNSMYNGSYVELGSLIDAPYTYRRKDRRGAAYVECESDGVVRIDGEDLPVNMQKKFKLSASRPELGVNYRIKNSSGKNIDCYFAVELNLSLLADDAPDRSLVIPSENVRNEKFKDIITAIGISRFWLSDGYLRRNFILSSDRIFSLWHYPIQTVSLSEDGFEKTYQGSSFILLFEMTLKPQEEFPVSISLTEEELK